jgi:CRP/FNR family transcriptional regulator, cyclic AMP receptor protein
MHQSDEDIAAIASALGCPTDLAAMIVAQSRIVVHNEPTALARQGDWAQGDWLILDGTVRSVVVSPEGRETVLTTYLPGDLVGGYGRGAAPLAASLETGATARLLALGESGINTLTSNDARFGPIIARCYASVAARLLDRLAQRISLSAAGRIHARLLEMSGPDHIISPIPVVAALAISVQTSRETASRTLSKLEQRGIIHRTRDSLIIQSPRMLEEMIV